MALSAIERRMRRLAREALRSKEEDQTIRGLLQIARNRVEAIEAQLPLPRPRAEMEADIDAITNVAQMKVYLKTLLPRN